MTYNLSQLTLQTRSSEIRDSLNRSDRQLLTVVFTDIKGFSVISERNESQALSSVRRYRDIVCQTTEQHQGTLLHFYGDGSLSVHTSAYSAVQCAIDMQRSFAGHGVTGSEATEDSEVIPVRIGVHLGEVVITEDTVYGNAVNIASRLQEMASARSILVSGAVAREIAAHPEIELCSLGQHTLKNIETPTEVLAVRDPHLVVPRCRPVRQVRSWRRAYSYIGLLLAATLVASFIVSQSSRFGAGDVLDKRVVVLPFENRTGNPALDDFSGYAAAFISRLMEEEDQIKIASARNLLEGARLQTFSTLPSSAILKRTNAENFIQGYFSHASDSTLLLSSVLVDGASGEIIEQFDDHFIDPRDPNRGLTATAQQIVGFFISAEFDPLTIPNEKAFKAYMEALRVFGVNNYADTRQLVLDAINYDSTFLDAYVTLADTYYNTARYATADSVMKVIRQKFRIETLNARQRNMIYFYDAFNAGNNSVAYKYLLNDYHENEKDIFRNTTAASYSLFFANSPRRALRVLRKIPVRQLDLELPTQRDRITIAVQANFALGRYKRAYKTALLYPSYSMTRREHMMRIRAFAGIGDTSAIENELTQVAMNGSIRIVTSMLYWTSQQFALLGDQELADHYLSLAHTKIMQYDLKTEERALVLYDMGRYREGLDHALFLHDYAPNWVPYSALVARGYALAGVPDSALCFAENMHNIPEGEQYRGQITYLEATVFAALGDHESALIELQNAIDEGCVFYEFNFEYDPRLKALFDMKEFRDIIHPLE